MKDLLLLTLFVSISFACSSLALAQPDASSARTSPTETEVLLHADAPGPEGRPTFGAAREEERERMVERQIARRGVSDEAVLAAMRSVPRHAFVPPDLHDRAYADSPLPIGHGQTISQPFIVAFMSETLQLAPGDRVLEIGTGSGYQAAILGAMGVEVVTIEIIRPLAEQAAALLDKLGYDNITAIHGDGYHGYQALAPYDAIIVTAAAQHVPPPLIEQLKPGQRMVIPVGRAGWTQNLLLVTKTEEGQTRTRNLMSVTFVPLTGEQRTGDRTGDRNSER
ncbi:protein-L-isoaspartate(D-aspartate) O-methyltransferase [Halochromatium roseum]|uniref:protein-L-isoaspartate(D-aspartate) O-methyltransferase n=1 Tax=Halochromatium roseum TaxID=391920 RepID=UPI0019121B2D|nr:protein-L-isoaspartate(D-aspartate) O-methyltransferase [Halochromatium roseum]MBK5941753.1 protein-L-isoaspartate O-methyltransferase [Halochromatium roseum]